MDGVLIWDGLIYRRMSLVLHLIHLILIFFGSKIDKNTTKPKMLNKYIIRQHLKKK